MKKIIWLRHETKPFEQRSALTPKAAQAIIKLGHEVVVEKSYQRTFADNEFKDVGCKIVATNSWITSAPNEAIILGLKELEDKDFILKHRHIHFAHCYKGQNGASKFLKRFEDGGGKLFDLEYLVDKKEKRIAAFGVWAGFTGAALGINEWALNQNGCSLNNNAPLRPYQNSGALVSAVKANLSKCSKLPKVIIIGANGRCGLGAQDFLKELGITATLWGSEDTRNAGPFPELLNFDVLINTVLMTKKTPPFLTNELIEQKRVLSVISDISCDPTGPFNPLPIYSHGTTMDKPSLVIKKGNKLSITAIDHLPSLLPRESSDDYSEQFIPHLIEYLEGKLVDTPWEKSLEKFYYYCEIYKQQWSTNAINDTRA